MTFSTDPALERMRQLYREWLAEPVVVPEGAWHPCEFPERPRDASIVLHFDPPCHGCTVFIEALRRRDVEDPTVIGWDRAMRDAPPELGPNGQKSRP